MSLSFIENSIIHYRLLERHLDGAEIKFELEPYEEEAYIQFKKNGGTCTPQNVYVSPVPLAIPKQLSLVPQIILDVTGQYFLGSDKVVYKFKQLIHGGKDPYTFYKVGSSLPEEIQLYKKSHQPLGAKLKSILGIDFSSRLIAHLYTQLSPKYLKLEKKNVAEAKKIFSSFITLLETPLTDSESVQKVKDEIKYFDEKNAIIPICLLQLKLMRYYEEIGNIDDACKMDMLAYLEHWGCNFELAQILNHIAQLKYKKTGQGYMKPFIDGIREYVSLGLLDEVHQRFSELRFMMVCENPLRAFELVLQEGRFFERYEEFDHAIKAYGEITDDSYQAYKDPKIISLRATAFEAQAQIYFNRKEFKKAGRLFEKAGLEYSRADAPKETFNAYLSSVHSFLLNAKKEINPENANVDQAKIESLFKLCKKYFALYFKKHVGAEKNIKNFPDFQAALNHMPVLEEKIKTLFKCLNAIEVAREALKARQPDHAIEVLKHQPYKALFSHRVHCQIQSLMAEALLMRGTKHDIKSAYGFVEAIKNVSSEIKVGIDLKGLTLRMGKGLLKIHPLTKSSVNTLKRYYEIKKQGPLPRLGISKNFSNGVTGNFSSRAARRTLSTWRHS